MKKLVMLLLLAAAGLASSCVLAIGNEGDNNSSGAPVVKSDNGTKYKLAVDDAGNLKTVKVN